MHKERVAWRVWLMTIIFLACGVLAGLPVASASTNAASNDQLKEQLRGEIVGNKSFPGEDNEYVIGHGDILSVSVYGEGSMAATTAAASAPVVGLEGEPQMGREAHGGSTGGVVVRMDGRVSLLHIGDVNVLGMTMTQATEYLKKLYSTVYSNPLVTVALIQSNSRRYTIMGQVRTPGVVSFDYPVTVVQAIARSGGFTEWANHKITVVRVGDGIKTPKGEDGKSTIKIDYDDLVKGRNLDKNIYLQSGDIVVVH